MAWRGPCKPSNSTVCLYAGVPPKRDCLETQKRNLMINSLPQQVRGEAGEALFYTLLNGSVCIFPPPFYPPYNLYMSPNSGALGPRPGNCSCSRKASEPDNMRRAFACIFLFKTSRGKVFSALYFGYCPQCVLGLMLGANLSWGGQNPSSTQHPTSRCGLRIGIESRQRRSCRSSGTSW